MSYRPPADRRPPDLTLDLPPGMRPDHGAYQAVGQELARGGWTGAPARLNTLAVNLAIPGPGNTAKVHFTR